MMVRIGGLDPETSISMVVGEEFLALIEICFLHHLYRRLQLQLHFQLQSHFLLLLGRCRQLAFHLYP